MTDADPDLGFEPATHGVPWGWAKEQIYDPALYAEAAVWVERWRRAGGRKWLLSRIVGYPDAPPVWREADRALADVRVRAAADRKARRHDSRLVLFGRRDSGVGPWRLIDPYAGDGLLPDRKVRGGWTSEGVTYFRVHLHDPFGLPAELAADLYAPERLWPDIKGTSEPGRPPQVVRDDIARSFAAQCQAGEIIEAANSVGVPLFRRPPPPPAVIGGWPGAEAPPAAEHSHSQPIPTAGDETACRRWILERHAKGERRKSPAWKEESLRHWPKLGARAWDRVWDAVRMKYPEVSKGGRPPKTETGT